jgi:hypothetical protein
MTPVLDSYDYTSHSTTKIAPYKVNEDYKIQVLENIRKRAESEKYPGYSFFELLNGMDM